MASTKPKGKQPKKPVTKNNPLYVHQTASARHLNIGVEIAKVFIAPANDQPAPSGSYQSN